MKSNITHICAQGLSANGLKAIACLFMLIDHWGMLICPQIMFLRYIGRLAFPIFAYMIGQGYIYSHNRLYYALRLSIFAILYQFPYQICTSRQDINIFGELFLGFLAIALFQQFMSKNMSFLAWIAVISLAVVGEAASFQYGFYGVALIFSGWLYAGQFTYLCFTWLAIHSILFLILDPSSSSQALALLALPLLSLYNGRRGRGGKWWFYIFFCIHLPLLRLLAEFVF